MKSLLFDGVEQEQEVVCFYFLTPPPTAIATLFTEFLDDLGNRFSSAGLSLTSRKIAILGRGGKKFSATARLIPEFRSLFHGDLNREITAQLAHFRDPQNLGMSDLRFSRATSGSPLGSEAQVFVAVVGATADILDWPDVERFWAQLADESGCDWAVFGQPFANRTVGRCVIGIADGVVTSNLACESVLEATRIDPRKIGRSFSVGESRIALFRDTAQPEGDSEWLDVVSLLAEHLMKAGPRV